MTPARDARRARSRGDYADQLEHADTFARHREEAERYPCDPPPHGCAQPAGQTCTVIGRPDLPLHRQPAHLGRLRRAGLAPPSTVGNGARRETDRPPHASVPEQNRHIYDDLQGPA